MLSDRIISPIIIIGMGGSGTRLPAELLHKMNVYMGKDINQSFDNLTFSFLFQRPRWYRNSIIHDSEQISVGFSTFINSTFGTIDRNAPEQIEFIRNAQNDPYHTFPQVWKDQRLQRMSEIPGPNPKQIDNWGWKLPQSDIFINLYPQLFPKMRLIFVQRHGLDMAFTDSFSNDQTKLWGPILYGIKPCSEELLPKANLEYWIHSNQKAEYLRDQIGEENTLFLKFEDLVQNPEQTTKVLARFIGKDYTDEQISKLCENIEAPQSIGRYKSKDLSIFSQKDFDDVESFGYRVS